MKSYSEGSHTIYHHRYHLVWITKYRYRVLRGELQRRVRTIIAQVAEELGVKIINGVVSSDTRSTGHFHIHLFVSIPPQLAVAEFVKGAKGRSWRKVQQEFPELRKRYWGRHLPVPPAGRVWARGYFSATSGNVTDEMIDETINNHYDAHKQDGEENIALE